VAEQDTSGQTMGIRRISPNRLRDHDYVGAPLDKSAKTHGEAAANDERPICITTNCSSL